MILYGAGGHARVIYDCLVSQGIKPKGVFDDNSELKSFFGLKVINPYLSDLFINEKLILCVGSNKMRYNLSERVAHAFGSVIHHTAVLALGTKVDPGAMLMAKSVIQSGSQIGKHTIVNTGAIVEHDCDIANFVHVGPGSVICGDVKIGMGSFIGANATVLPGLSIGKWAVVGAGSVVLRNVGDGEKIAGNPAKTIGN